MINAYEAMKASNINAKEIESELEQNCPQWNDIVKCVMDSVHKGQRNVFYAIKKDKRIDDILTVLKYNGYGVKTYFRYFEGYNCELKESPLPVYDENGQEWFNSYIEIFW